MGIIWSSVLLVIPFVNSRLLGFYRKQNKKGTSQNAILHGNASPIFYMTSQPQSLYYTQVSVQMTSAWFKIAGVSLLLPDEP